METPAKPTKIQTTTGSDQTHSFTVCPWGDTSPRMTIEQSVELEHNEVRKRLKAHAAKDYPAGKAMARQHYFCQQRGLESFLATENAKKAKTGNTRPKFSIPESPQPSFKAQAAAATPVWRELGPTLIPHGQTYGHGLGSTPSVSGRCSGIIVDQQNSRHLILCSASGGLWGSNNAGATWAPLTDNQATLIMGAIAQSPSAPAIMYAATGDGDGGIPYGIGLLRSTDAGNTWQAVPIAGLSGLGSYDLAIDPGNPLKVWIATDQALFVSTNGGNSVRKVIPGKCWSVAIQPTQSNVIYAALESGLMRSTDGGTTWSAVRLPGTSANTLFSRLEVSLAKGGNPVAYVAGCANEKARLWRASGIGAAFKALNVPDQMDTGQAWYDWCLHTAIADPNIVFWGAIDLFKGVVNATGQVNWENISSRDDGDSIHPDQHFVTSDPNQPNTIYACNDGGLFRSSNLGQNWQSLNPGLGITEFEFIAQLESVPAWLIGGTQDNGSLAMAGALQWNQIALGDGGDCSAVERGNASICYHSYYNMPIERAPALGAQAFGWHDVSPPTPEKYDSLFYPPMEAKNSLLVKAGSSVWVSGTDGNTWAEVLLPTSHLPSQDLATSIAIVDDNTMVVGMESGRLWRIAGANNNWANANVTALATLPNNFVSDLTVLGNGQVIWASCSHIGGAHLLCSKDSGASFTDCTGDLPDIAVNAFVVDPINTKTIYLATDHGVYRSLNSGKNWVRFSNGLPNVIVGDILLHATSRLLRIGTRARGAWELSI